MVKLIKYSSINTFCMISFILLSSLFISEKVFSQVEWNRSLTKVSYNPLDTSISMKFVVFDYYFLVKDKDHVHAYLEICEFSYSTIERNFKRLMRVTTKNQPKGKFTELMMSDKKKGIDLQFLGCNKPKDGTKWLEKNKKVNIKLINSYKTEANNPIAIFTVKWFLGVKYKNVKYICLYGFWSAKGLRSSSIHTYYEIPKTSVLKSTIDQSENIRVKVAANADAIVITGADTGENIKVYNLAEVEVRSTFANRDFVNITLPKNQIYFVQIGQTYYKVAM